MRDACREVILQTAARNTWVDLQKQILSGDLEQAVEKAARTIVSVKTVMIRKSQLVQDGVNMDDGPTLDEIREEESRVAAAKKAALAAAMEDEESEDEAPDVLAAAEAAADADDSSEEDDSEDEPAEQEVVAEEAEAEVEESTDTPDYASMKVAELKELLKAAGKPVSGKKDELIARLME